MKYLLSRSPNMASGAHPLTITLLGLFLVSVAIFMFPPDERVPESPQKKKPSEKSVSLLNEKTSGSPRERAASKRRVFTSREVTPGPEQTEIQGDTKADPKKLGYNLGFNDKTGQGSVRASNVKVGVDYKVSENATVGVQASQGMHDSQDASAWGKSVDDETAAQAKYKLSF